MWRAVLAEPRASTALSCVCLAPLLGLMLYPCIFEITFSFYCKFSAFGQPDQRRVIKAFWRPNLFPLN